MPKLSIRRKLMLALAVVIGLMIALYASKTPSHVGNWTLPQQRLASVTINDTDFLINGVRDFRYDDKLQVERDTYLDRHYVFNDLGKLWFGLSHFGENANDNDNGLAHAFLSFEFSGQRYLTLSIEARLEQGQHYHPLRGLLRNYEKIYIFGTEADIIGLRSHYRQERVLLYPLKLDQDTWHRAIAALFARSATTQTASRLLQHADRQLPDRPIARQRAIHHLGLYQQFATDISRAQRRISLRAQYYR